MTRYVFLGDSITEGVGSAKRYSDYFAEISGGEVHNYGVNGAQSFELQSQIWRMEEEIGNKFDVLCIFIGTNDFNMSVPLGEWFSESDAVVPAGLDENGMPFGKVARKKRDFIFTEDTFRGRMNTVLNNLRERYADKRIVLLTPIHRAYAFFGGDNYQPSELYSNKIGEFFDKYVQVVREAADIWGCELIDMYRDSGMFPLSPVNVELYFHDVDTDRLHPNAKGHERMAKVMWKHLKED